jgi:superfamily I DNA and RNA helicase
MVYVIDGQNCGTDFASAKSRNILFTAMTRSKAWVRVIGYGTAMQSLQEEFSKIKRNDFKLDFVYPNKTLRNKLNIIHRDKSKYEEQNIDKRVDGLEKLINDIENGNMYLEDIPEKLREKLKGIIADE